MTDEELTGSNRLARVVRVAIRKDDRGVFVATSANLKGLVAVSKDMDRLVSTIIPQAIADLYRAAGEPVVRCQGRGGERGGRHTAVGSGPY